MSAMGWRKGARILGGSAKNAYDGDNFARKHEAYRGLSIYKYT